MKYEFIRKQRTQLCITRLCRLLGVSRSGYYDWLDRPASKRALRHEALTKKIRSIHTSTRQIYGSPRVHSELLSLGEVVGQNTVALLMRRAGIQARTHRRFIVTTNSRHAHRAAPNRLKRRFNPDQPNQRWVADVTGIETRKGWLYLATVMDLYSRRIIGWSMNPSNCADLVCNAMKMALNGKGSVAGALAHSDRGKPYVSREYQQLLAENGLVCSMSAKGDCWDNAPMESFYHSLKTEWVFFDDYRTHDQARTSVFNYIERFYNRKRRHSTLAYQSPLDYEQSMCA